MSDVTDALNRARAQLLGMKDNIPELSVIDWRLYVEPFHKIISDLESAGCNVNEFRVEEKQSRMVTQTKMVDPMVLRAKVVALFTYIDGKISSSPPS